MVDVIGAYLVGKIRVVGWFAGICGERWFAVAFGGMDMK